MPSRRRSARSPTSRPAPGAELRLGIDLGATNVRAVLVDVHGRIRAHSGRHALPDRSVATALSTVERVARGLLAPADLPRAPLGISVAAQVDPDRGRVVHAPNLRWRDVPFGGRLARRLERPVRLVNDARAATFAEWQFGAGRGCADVFGLQLGTGVGGSAVVGGRLLEGGRHAAGEVGHLTIVAGGRPCTCPNRGCFEAYVGGWAIAERAHEAASAQPHAARALLARSGRRPGLTAEAVFDLARSGNPFARNLVRETESYFAAGVVSIANAFNPTRMVLGGGLAAGWPGVVAVARRAIRTRCQPPAARVRVFRAQLGDLAPAVGAAALAGDGSG
jgi:glucokinase